MAIISLMVGNLIPCIVGNTSLIYYSYFIFIVAFIIKTKIIIIIKKIIIKAMKNKNKN